MAARVEGKLHGAVELLVPPMQTSAAQKPPGAAPPPAHGAGDLRRVVAMISRLEASSATKVRCFPCLFYSHRARLFGV